MKQTVLNELNRDYMGTFNAWKEAYNNKDYKTANVLREQLVGIRDRINYVRHNM